MSCLCIMWSCIHAYTQYGYECIYVCNRAHIFIMWLCNMFKVYDMINICINLLYICVYIILEYN